MPESDTTLYEGLFLMSPQVSGDVNAATDHVREVLERASAEVVVLRRWDERRLAYPIRGQKRGLYLLAMFNAAGKQIANIERDCNLSESVVRVLMTRADHMGETEIETAQQDSDTARAEAQLREDGSDVGKVTSDNNGNDDDSSDRRKPRRSAAAAD